MMFCKKSFWLELCVHLHDFVRWWSTSLTMSMVMYFLGKVVEQGSCAKTLGFFSRTQKTPILELFV